MSAQLFVLKLFCCGYDYGECHFSCAGHSWDYAQAFRESFTTNCGLHNRQAIIMAIGGGEVSDGPTIDLGAGVTVTLRTCECTGEGCDHSKPCGMMWAHTRPDGEVCLNSGYIPFGNPHWTVESVDPLTLSPSLLCMRPECKRHGFVRGGKWVEA